MTVVKVVEDVAFGAHWSCQTMGRGLCAKIRAGGSPRASREPLVASADEPSVGPEKDRHFSHGGFLARCRRLIIVDASDAHGRIRGLPVLLRSRVDRRERGSRLEQPSMGTRSGRTVVVAKAGEGRARVGNRRITGASRFSVVLVGSDLGREKT